MSAITNQLDILIEHIENKGFPINNHLKPGLNRKDIDRKTQSLPFTLPDELYQLFSWRNGQDYDVGVPLFGDEYFLSIEEAIIEYEHIIHGYCKSMNDDFLKMCFPFSTFEGSYNILPSVSQPLVPTLRCPVISVFEGIEVIYLNFSTMLDTFIAYFSEGAYSIFKDTSDYYLESDELLQRSILWRLNPYQEQNLL